MIEFRQVVRSYLPQYDQIPMRFHVKSYYRIDKIDRGLHGFQLIETPVEPPYIKDFCADIKDSMTAHEKRWDVSNWAFFMAFDDELPIGGVTVVTRTEGINMLSGRDDLAVLWDIRVDGAYKHRGIGQALFDMAVKWARAQGMRQMKIECQNNNVPAVKFYHKQGAVLAAIDEYAYYHEPEYRHEAQLIWMLALD